SDGWPVCVPQPEVVSLEDLRAEESGQVANLAACFNSPCHANTSMSVCMSTSSCTWCTRDGATGETLQYPYCNGQGACRDITKADDHTTVTTQQDYAKDNSSHESRRGAYRLSHVWDGLLTKTTGEQRKYLRPRIPDEASKR
ncbi:hypothetical protein LSAT2_009997, partial [Lamellibrachia satsuma]